jgi:hypothetical protein
MGPGEYFGERALVTSEPRMASVVALTDVKCLCLSREAFTMLRGSMNDMYATQGSNPAPAGPGRTPDQQAQAGPRTSRPRQDPGPAGPGRTPDQQAQAGPRTSRPRQLLFCYSQV